MTIRKIHSNDVTTNRADIATQYDDIFFDDSANSILLPDPTGLLEMKIGPTGSGSMNWAQNSINSTNFNSAGTVITVQITTTGKPVLICANGDANPLSAGGWCILQLFRDNTAIGKKTQTEGSAANENNPYSLSFVDNPPAGTYTYSLRIVTIAGGQTYQFGEADGPVIYAIELSGAQGPQGPAGVGIKGFASGYVDAGQFVTLDNLKFGVTTGGQRGLCCATVSGTATLSISANYALAGGASGYATSYPGANYTTTPSGSWFGWSFANAGDGSVYNVNDYTNKRFYRVTLMIGASYLSNFISIERLY